MRGSKWIPGTRPKQGVAKAARRALSVRLGEACRLLPLAALHADEDVEYVHQLRVASRRAVAALDAFWDLLPADRKWLRKRLKRVRRAAGEARDHDVMLARFAGEDCPELAGVVAHLKSLRRAAQVPLIAIERRLSEQDWQRASDNLVAGVRWRRGGRQPTFANEARRRLRAVFKDFLRAARADFADLDAVHRFRIAGKRLRYSMELFAGAMPRDFRKRLYPQVEALQERLGTINDHVTAARRLELWAQTAPPELARPLLDLAGREQALWQAGLDDFQRWWTPKLVRQLRDEFAGYLS
jgi:CHAD domain-containing protein